MAITPNTNLYLLKCPLELSNSNQLTWNNKEEQYNYFSSLPRLENDNFTYQRKDSIIRYPAHVDEIINYNYVMYQNTNYSNKWFYAYITNMRYISDYTTEITIKTDVFQTWQFDMDFKYSFVEREHVSNDGIGLHTVPEGLELGDYTTIFRDGDTYNNDYTNVLASTTTPDELIGITGGVFGGIPSGIRYYRYDNVGLPSDTSSTTLLGAINRLNKGGKADAITGLFIAPKWLAGGDSTNIPIANSNAPEVRTIDITRITTLDGYTPKNNKLLTYPYITLVISNNMGQANSFMPERWTLKDNKYQAEIMGVLTPSCSIRCYPINYNGESKSYDEGITLGKFPQLNWITDQYTNWLTQNGIGIGSLRIPANVVNLAEPIVDIATSKNSADVSRGLSGIYNAIKTNYQHSIIPNTAEGNLNSGDSTTGAKENRFYFIGRTIKKEYAEIIDNYFNMYGYKVNSVKIPNLKTRSNWNYIKCIGANIHGYFNQDDLNEITNMFNAGITLWHNANTFLDYSQNNTILGG